MNSTELTNLGEWKRWHPSTAWGAPLASAIYVFRLTEGKTIPRLKGESDIVYVGFSKKIRNRFKNHLRVADVERNLAYRLQRVENDVGRLEISWESYETPDEAKDAERLLLAKYEMDHIELPPLNRLESGKSRRMVEEWLKLKNGGFQDLAEAIAKIRSG